MAFCWVGDPTNKQNLRVTPHLSYELDHRRLLDKHRGMFDPCGDVSDSLVQTARKLGAFVVFL